MANSAIARLTPLVGEWTQQVGVTGIPAGRAVFEWVLGGSFLQQRNEIPHPDFPDSLLIMAADPDGESYSQHYFDSRGIARVTADFAPLDFAQRFTGTFADDSTINGAWEHLDGATWKRDFGLTFKKIG